jgi:hypothetical protein
VTRNRFPHRLAALGLLLLVAAPGCHPLEGDLAAWLVQLGASREPNFRKSRSVAALVEPSDRELYRRLLPAQFEMPERPMVSISVADQIEVGPWPLVPYQLGAVSLRCRWKGEEGWHPVTMPENRWVAVWTGRTMGYPKYLADEIHLSPEGEDWTGEVRHQGEVRLRLEFRPRPQTPLPAWQERGWSMGGPTFNLRPPGEGPDVKTVRGAEEKRGTARSEIGLVRIAIAASEPWSGLVPSGTEVPGTLVLWEGGRSLAPED